MTKYEYKVDFLKAEVSEGDAAAGVAGTKIVQQIEIKLKEYMDKGFELYQQNVVMCAEKPGCFSALFGKKVDYFQINVLVFRKEIK